MNFLGLPERINRVLYRREVHRLTPADLRLARRWTLELIQDSHPRWSREEVEACYERLSELRVTAVDEWSKRNGVMQSI
jgi:hypothetical protein